MPEVLRHLRLLARVERADLGPDIVGEPVHRRAPPRTASASARTLACTAGHQAGRGAAVARRDGRRAGRPAPSRPRRHRRCARSRPPARARGCRSRPRPAGACARLMRATSGATRSATGRLLAGDAGDRDVVDEAADVLEHRRQAPVVGGRRGEADEVEAGRARRQAQLGVLLRRQVDDDQPVDPGRLGVGEEALVAVAVDRVVVAHQHDRRRRRRRRGSGAPARACVAMRAPAASARRLAAWIAGPSAIGSVNGMPISIRSAPAAGRPASSSQRGREVGVARGQEGDQPRAARPRAARAKRARRSGPLTARPPWPCRR